ncbi:hypothetical protein RQP55_10490 [Novosphingobium sp. APW14]|nr:hypothetical protein [Novosphingobium sp. APW14]MDT9013854.1 hypothetical protein [Novosphingobium sp. APW14]
MMPTALNHMVMGLPFGVEPCLARFAKQDPFTRPGKRNAHRQANCAGTNN